MNKTFTLGRLTKDPMISTSDAGLMIARFNMAIDRPHKKDEEAVADFPSFVAFGDRALFVQKYLKKGGKYMITGRLQTGSYTNPKGDKVYTTDILVEEIEFCERASQDQQEAPAEDGYVSVDVAVDEELPFK